ncbi:hypothetical protein D9601_12720 [Sphingomonas sp. MA1305]|uniref:hypothetical protein n=1 Tax=unclassified Sphingomonas TaxID=196159 RepID=UPI0018E0066B|nr:hypothetical protein [Sphingomonas sp. MA1305]MBI0476210.1 hypothetical protein [Sphingomonas sp. MA1305]
MDLSFPGFDKDAEVTRLPGDLAVLMVGIAARQNASATATAQARFGRMYGAMRRLQPASGAFNGQVASLLAHWHDSEQEPGE